MALPGFSAETSLYRTSVHYRLTGVLVQADEIAPQQIFCGPCYSDDTGACLRNCRICIGFPFPRCFTNTVPCDPSACPPFDPCNCRQRCCPSGVCHPGIEHDCWLECITFCGQ
jgi:hypothetical protein